MSFARYFRFWSFCLIAAGFAALVITGSVDPLSLALFGSSLACSLFYDTAHLQRRIPSWTFNLLAVCYLAFYFVDYRYLSRSFVLSTIHLIFFVSAIKILTRASDRDYIFLYLLSFAELLAASTLTIDISFALIFFIFLLSGVSTLILFEMRRSNWRVQAKGGIQPLVVPKGLQGSGMELFAPFPARSVFVLTLAITITILLLAVPFFFVLPRISLGIYSRPSGKNQMVSGFSERVRLGEIGTIKESDVIVMRVRVIESPAQFPANLKWRGIALEQYDGRSWSRSRMGRHVVPVSGAFFKLEEYSEGTGLLWQSIILEALSTDVVFVTHKALAVSSDLNLLEQDAGGSLFARKHPSSKTRYVALSEIRHPDPGLIYSAPEMLPAAVKSTCLQLPSLDPRISLMAKEVTRSAVNPYRKAQLIEEYLQKTCRYSLELKGHPSSPDPLAMFLFDVKQGHCEYFATAMAIMLRQLGIPARIVNGFRAGEYNTLGQGWIVRQYDAHSWVEGYFLPYGWLEFDPTPADPERSRSALSHAVTRYLDAIDLWWAEEVINYDRWRQFGLIEKTRTRLEDLQQRTRNLWLKAWDKGRSDFYPAHLTKSFTQITGALLLAIGLILLAVVLSSYFLRHRLRRFWLRMRRYLLPREGRWAVAGFYAEALDVMNSNGLIRRRDQTPLEFAESLGEEQIRQVFTALTRIYNRIRFGGITTEEDTGEASRLLQLLRESIRSQ